MHAVIVTGGKQYRVAPGQTLKVESLAVEAGQEVVFDKVLLVTDGDNIKVGQPFVDGAKVKANVVEHGRHKKVNILKFRRRKHSMSRMGHRQNFTEVKIGDISA